MNSLLAKNEGTIDRVLRVVAGVGLIGAAAAEAIGSWGYLGAIPLATGLLGSCPLYSLFGIRTCPLQPASPGNTKRNSSAA